MSDTTDDRTTDKLFGMDEREVIKRTAALFHLYKRILDQSDPLYVPDEFIFPAMLTPEWVHAETTLFRENCV